MQECSAKVAQRRIELHNGTESNSGPKTYQWGCMRHVEPVPYVYVYYKYKYLHIVNSRQSPLIRHPLKWNGTCLTTIPTKKFLLFFLKVPSLSSRYKNWRCAITITTQLFFPLKAPFVWKHCSCHKSQVLRVKRKPLILTHRIMRSFIQIFMPPPVLQPSISQDCSRMQCTSSLKEQEAA